MMQFQFWECYPTAVYVHMQHNSLGILIDPSTVFYSTILEIIQVSEDAYINNGKST